MNSSWKTVVLVWLVLAGSSLLVSSLLGLGDAEALYFCYGRHPQLSYLDHPPLIGWLIGLAVRLGGVSVLSVRVVPMAMTLLALLFTFVLARDLFGPGAGAWSALLLLATPVFSAGMTGATPDAPLVALWPLVTWQLHRAAVDRRSGIWPDLGRPVLIGILVGLAFLAKYTGLCLAVSALIVAVQIPGRAWLKRPGFWLGAICALAVASPVIVWNIRHDWIGLAHRLVWTQQGAGFSVRNAGALIGGQLLYVGPLMLPLLVWGALRVWRDRGQHPERLVLLAASLPALFLTYLLVLWSDVAEPHWPAAGYMPLFAAAAGLAASRTQTRPLRRLTRLSLGYGIAAFALLQVVVLTALVPRVVPPDVYEPKYDISNELRGWPEVASAIRALDPARRPVLGAFYTQCSQLAFALSRQDDPEVRCVSPEIDDFDLWHGPFTLPDTGALFVTDNRFEHDPETLVARARVNGPPTVVEIKRVGRWVRRFYLYDLEPSGGSK